MDFNQILAAVVSGKAVAGATAFGSALVLTPTLLGAGERRAKDSLSLHKNGGMCYNSKRMLRKPNDFPREGAKIA